MHWLAEDFHADNGTPELIKELEKRGIPYSNLSYRPFKSGEYPEFDQFRPFVFVGSINLAEQIIEQKPEIRKHFWSTFENYDCNKYLQHIGKYCLNGEDYAFYPFRDFLRQKWNAYSRFAVGSRIFIRPNAGLKEFTGAVIDFQDIDHQIEYWKPYTKESSMVLVSKPVSNIVFEWRIIVAKHEKFTGIVAASLYKMNGENTYVPSAPKEATDLAQIVLDILPAPDPMYCIDVCRVDNEYKVVEINAFSTAGHYKADKGKIIDAANKIAFT